MSVTLSVCAIVKNEEENIEGLLKDVINFADEVIILDTGSFDDTKDIVQEFLEKSKTSVYLFDYENKREIHQGKAWNASMKKATKDYILITAADHRYSKEFKENIKKFLKEKKPIVANITRYDDLLPVLVDYMPFIIKNNQGIFFGEDEKSRRHEQLQYNGERMLFDFPVWHCQKNRHYLKSPQKILFPVRLEIDGIKKEHSFFWYFLKAIRGFFFKFKKIYFKKKLYKEGIKGLKFSFLKGLYIFLVNFFVGLKPKEK